jgi:amino acid transporter
MEKALLSLVAVFALWIAALIFLSFSANDLFTYPLLRSRTFAATLNLVLAFLTLLILFKNKEEWMKRPLILLLPLSGWALCMLGLWPVFLASFTGPPWKDSSPPIPISAATPFMQDVWAWENRK